MNGVITKRISIILINIIVPNHLNTFTQIKNNNNQIIHVVILPSLIADQDLSYQSSIAHCNDFPHFTSSRILSYINIFESIVIHNDNTIAAIQLNDETIHNNFVIPNKNTKNHINPISAILAFFHPYKNIIIMYVINIPNNHAINAPCNAFCPSDGAIVSSCDNNNGAGNAQLFSSSASFFAHLISNDPSIWADHPQILS